MLTAFTEILIILLLLMVNGILAMSEMALVSARRAHLQQRADAGDAAARVALELTADPNRFLSTIQIGITLIGILAGAFGGATLARSLAQPLSTLPGVAPYSEALAVGLVVLAITYCSLVIGELVPKRLGLRHAEGITRAMARPMRLLSTVAAPAVAVLSLSTEAVLWVFGARPGAEEAVTEEEIKLLLEQGTQAGVFEVAEEDIVKKVFRLSDRDVAELMTPRPRVIWLDVDDAAAANWQKIAASRHSQFPVCRGALDEVLGTVHVRDLVALRAAGQPVDLRSALQPALFVPESLPALRVLERFKQAGGHFALVVDEFGGTAGVLTITDVLEALVGDLPAAGDPVEPQVVQREDGSWLVDGFLPVEEFKEWFEVANLPDEDDYDTVAGFAMTRLGRVPITGDQFEWGGYRFEIVDMDGHRIDKLLVQATDRG
jgi:putative hemolysin